MDHSPEFNNPELIVIQGEWKMASKGIISTSGASSCSIVAAYDKQNKLGYLGHFGFYQEGRREMVGDMLLHIKSSNPVLEDVIFWLTGAGPLPDDMYTELVEHEKMQYKNILLTAGVNTSAINENWLEKNQDITRFAIDIHSGNVELATQPYAS